MGRVVQGETHGQDEDDRGRNFNGQAHEVSASCNVQECEDNTEEHESTDSYISYQKKIYNSYCSKC